LALISRCSGTRWLPCGANCGLGECRDRLWPGCRYGASTVDCGRNCGDWLVERNCDVLKGCPAVVLRWFE
jgi:hypothetical protein